MILTSQRYKEVFDKIVKSWRVIVHIKDDNDAWVDFSDRLEGDGENLLISIGNLSFVSEKSDNTGLTSSRNTSISFFNKDRFFNKRVSGLNTIAGAASSFASSNREKHSIFYDRDIRILVEVYFQDGRFEQGIVAEYKTSGIRTTLMSPVATMSILDKSLMLRKSDSAERVKDGHNWFKNIPIDKAILELLKVRYAGTDGSLPSSFVIPDRVEIQSANSLAGLSGDNRVVSHFGRMPEKDDAGAEIKTKTICRALVFAPKSGHLSTDANPLPFAIGGTGNHRLYMGCDDKLYEWNPATEQATLVGTISGGHKIQRLWYSTEQRKIYILAYNILLSSPIGTTNRIATIKLYKYDGTNFTQVKSIDDVFIAEYCYRDGRTDAGDTFVGQWTGGLSGENVTIPYPHKVIARGVSGVWLLDKKETINQTGNTTEGILPGALEPGYYSFSTQSLTVIADIRFSLGQQGFFVLNSNTVSDVWLWYSTLSGSTVRLRRVNLLTGSTEIMDLSILVSSNQADMLCGCPDNNSSAIYYAAVAWNDSSGLTVSRTAIKKITSGTITTELFNSNDNAGQNYYTPLEMIHDTTTGKLLVSMMARDSLNNYDTFILATHSLSVGTAMNVIKKRNNQFKGFAQLAADEYAMYEVGGGTLYRYAISSNSLVTIDLGFPCVDNEYGLFNNPLAVDTDTRSGSNSEVIYGVSSPVSVPVETFDAIPTGKYYLFKADDFYSGRIELLKLDGLSVWKALELIAQLANYKTGFTRDGRFYFVSNSFETASDYEFDLEASNKRIIDIRVTTGEGDVYNIVRAKPYSVFLNDLQWEMSLVSKEEILDNGKTVTEEQAFNSEVIIQQNDDQRKTITIEFMTSGLISNGEIFFRYRMTDQKFETSLNATYTASATTLTIPNGIESVRKGDTIVIHGNGNKETDIISSTPTDAEKETGTVNIDDGFDNNYAIRDLIEITNNLSDWSDKVGNIIQNPFFLRWSSSDAVDWDKSQAGNVEDHKDTSVYRYGIKTARLKLTSETDDYILQSISKTEFDASSKYTVGIDIKCFEGDGTDKRTDEIELKVVGLGAIEAEVSVSSSRTDWTNIQVTFTTRQSMSGNIEVQVHVKGTVPTKGWVDGCCLKKGLVANLDIVKVTNSQFIPIADSNIEIKFEPQTTETKILAGDRLIIRAEGLDLKTEDNSIQTAINTLSKAKYGELPYPDIDNRFLGRSLARDIVQRVLNDNAFPKYMIELISPVLPYIDFITGNNKVTTITVISKELFVNSGEWRERCRLRSINDSLSNGIGSYLLRSLDDE